MGNSEIPLPQNLSFKEIRKVLKTTIENLQNKLDSLKNVVRSYEKNIQIVSPALRWAQSKDFITMEIKFSHRFDSPGCLELENLETNISYDKILHFSGFCFLGDVPIKFEMNLKLFEEINRLQSSFSAISVGKYMINLRKKKSEKWPSVLRDLENIPNNLQLWLERQMEFDQNENEENDKKTEDEEEEEEIVEKKEKKKKRKPKYQFGKMNLETHNPIESPYFN